MTYQVCTQCVLDATAGVTFDENGVCSLCHERDMFMATEFCSSYTPSIFGTLIASIKREGKGKDYDCVIGPSGGVDSSYVALLVRELGLRPLAVHLDNGGDTEQGRHNVSQVEKVLGFPVHYCRLDKGKFAAIQRAYYRASVLGIDNPSDHFIMALLWHTAVEHSIRYILSGHNYATESMIPPAWAHNAYDLVNIRDICRQYGASLDGMPVITQRERNAYMGRGVQVVRLLNFYPYVKAEAKAHLERELGWQDYGCKHGENIYTRFAQCYLLPIKFGIDKRRYHFSSLVRCGQMDREDALAELERPSYDYDLFCEDREFVLRSLGLTMFDLDEVMTTAVRPHTFYRVGRDGQPLSWRLYRAAPPPVRVVMQTVRGWGKR